MSGSRAANAVWRAASLPRARRFLRALRDPETAQRRLLRGYLRRNAETVYGRRHGFAAIDGIAAFRRRVPVLDGDDLEPLIGRIRRGERGVLTAEPVRRLVPSSGSTAARKLLPWTATLQAELGRAIAAWVCDLFADRPALMDGPAYWSVSPAIPEAEDAGSAVPIGFEEDSAYLGGRLGGVVRRALAVPEAVRHARDVETFRYLTALGLLRCAGLRMISVWHPAFLALLLEGIERHWTALLRDIADGTITPPGAVPEALRPHLRRWRSAARRRAQVLGAAGPREHGRIWPRLALISCWADGPAAGPAHELRRRFPGVALQPKGLLATEGVVTVPIGGRRPVAVDSHLFEFLDERGRPRGVTELRAGETYGVLLTTGGGLYRYRLRDRVRVEGVAARTPCLRFIGKEDQVSDLCGEKLDAGFVAGVLEGLFADRRPAFAMLAPDRRGGTPCYTLYVESASPPPAETAERLDEALSENPHYRYCRRLGQLGPTSVFRVDRRAHAAYLERERSRGRRIGDIKPTALSAVGEWTLHLEGRYVTAESPDRSVPAPPPG